MIDLSSFRPVKPSDSLLFQEYFGPGYKGPPRFWRSPTYLSSDSANLIGRLNGCLVVIRRKILHGNPVLYLSTPPLGDRRNIAELIQEFAQIGVTTKVSEWDIETYGLTASPQKDNIEYSYQGEPPPPGHDGRYLRAGKNALDRLTATGEVRFTSSESLGGLVYGCVELSKLWYRQRKGVSNTHKNVACFSTLPKTFQRWAHVIESAQKVIAFSLTEQIGPGQVAIIMRLRDYSIDLASRLNAALHVVDCSRWSGYNLTIGSSVGVKGLDDHKKHLGNVTGIQIYNTTVQRKLTIQDYRDLTESKSLIEDCFR